MDKAMDVVDVRIVKLAPMRVASVYAYGSEPEHAAWAKLEAWAGPRGLMNEPEGHRIFGFNNPNPSEGSPNYGYEFWVCVGPEVEAEGEVRIEGFDGGLYAVTRVEMITEPYEQIPAGWMALSRWLEESQYQYGGHQWLEEHLTAPDLSSGKFSLDLYLPIAE